MTTYRLLKCVDGAWTLLADGLDLEQLKGAVYNEGHLGDFCNPFPRHQGNEGSVKLDDWDVAGGGASV